MKTRVIEHDFKVGGSWKYVMLMPDGNEFITEGVYSAIVELERIVSSADFKPMTEGVEIQALFEENGIKPISLLMLFIQQRNIADNKRKWAFIMVGPLLLIGWKLI